jgi:hypothetical protein
MRGPLRCVVIAGLLVGTGCGDDSSMAGNDASAGGGFVVSWSSTPSMWPGRLRDGLTLERAAFALDSLRIVGDAAAGDPRTTASSRELRWDDTSVPDDVGFPDAPGGVYSQLSLVVDGHVAGPSVEIRGHARVGGTDYEYRITDDSPFAVTLATDKTLQPPDVTRVDVRVDFARVIEAINFDTLAIDNGRLRLANGDSQFATFRAALFQAFVVL